jgi:hypothetical protein
MQFKDPRWREDLALIPPLRTSRKRWCFGRDDIKKHRPKVRPLQMQTNTLTLKGELQVGHYKKFG